MRGRLDRRGQSGSRDRCLCRGTRSGRPGVWRGRSRGNGPAFVSSSGAAEALHLRLSQPGPVEPARQPHHLNVAPSFTLQSPARLDPVEIAVNVELQQDRRMIRRPAGYLGIDPAEPKFGQIEFVDKDLDHANRIVLADPVCHVFRKQRALHAIRPLNEALHLILPQIARESYPENQIQRCVFTQPGSLAAKLSPAKTHLCLLCPQKRTNAGATRLSAKCQTRTYHIVQALGVSYPRPPDCGCSFRCGTRSMTTHIRACNHKMRLGSNGWSISAKCNRRRRTCGSKIKRPPTEAASHCEGGDR